MSIYGTNGSDGENGTGADGGMGETVLRTISGSREPNESYFELFVYGGHGGHAGSGSSGTQDFINGGNGGDGGGGGAALMSFNSVEGYGSLYAVAQGGGGGAGGGGGNGYSATYNGGQVEAAGNGGNGGNGATGSDGTAEIVNSSLTLSNSTNVLQVRAEGGWGGGGGGAGQGGESFENSGPVGYAGSAGHAAAGANAIARIGGNNVSFQGNLEVYASARGGFGGNGGNGGHSGSLSDGTRIYTAPTSGANAGASHSEISNNLFTGSIHGQALSFVIESQLARGGTAGIAGGLSWDGITDGTSTVSTLAFLSNRVDLGGSDDTVELNIKLHEGGSFAFSGNTLIGGDGFDTLVLNGLVLNASGQVISGLNFDLGANSISGFEKLQGSDQADALQASADGMTLAGMGGADQLIGGSGNDTLDGGTGADQLTGGLGDDIYIVDTLDDVVSEEANAGTDRVESSVDYTVGAGVENLTLTGTAAAATGNELDNILLGNGQANTLVGNAGNDTLDGGAAADTMVGGAGNDVYYRDDSADAVIEYADEGTDLVYSSVTYGLAGNVENLVLTGTGAINGYGNSLGNSITGNAAANVLNGASGADTLRGGGGDDRYYIEASSDAVIELADQGTDLVYSSVTYGLTGNVEHLSLTGSTNINGYGNSLSNTINGNSGDNVLNGAVGADTMRGGLGNDRYYRDNAGDAVVEASGQGTDIVYSWVSYGLGANLEHLSLIGTAAINGYGNELANTINGNSASNVLNGGLGADTLRGGAGDDVYYRDDAGDAVVEASGQGTDLVYSSVSYGLGANLEKLILSGTDGINGHGNTLDNSITGNGAANTLNGNDGNDVLRGAAGNDALNGDNGADWLLSGDGNDTLSGGAGGDSFLFETGLNATSNVDRITDFSAADDTMVLDQTVFSALTTTGTLDASAFRAGTAAQDADDRIIYDSTTGRIYYDADGNGAEAQVLFAQVNAGAALTNADFLIVG